MSNRDWKLRIEDILESIEQIDKFISGMAYEAFCNDRKTINAVLYSIAVIGEAARHVPKDIRKTYKEIPWREMGDIRNVVVHEYFGVDLKILWETISFELPSVRHKLKKLLD